MTILKTPTNTQLRTMPFSPKSGYSMYQSEIDHLGRTITNSAMGDEVVGQRVSQLALSFQVGIFDDQVGTEITGGGLTGKDVALATVSAFNAGDACSLQALHFIDFQSGYDGQGMFDARFTKYIGDAVVRQEISLSGKQNGYLFFVDQGNLGVMIRRNSVDEIIVNQDDFNMDKVDGTGRSGFNLDITKINTYRIQFSYIGNMPVFFEVFGGHLLGWIPIHVFDNANKQTFLDINNQSLPIRVAVEVVSGTPDVPIVVGTGSWLSSTLGTRRGSESASTFAVKNNVIFGATGGTRNIISLQVLKNMRGQVSLTPINIARLALANTGDRQVELDMYFNPTLPDAVWQDVELDESVVQFATNDLAVNGGRYIGSVYASGSGAFVEKFVFDQLRLNRGDIISFVATSTKAADVSLSLQWGEIR